jgi:hypothetical protein
MSVQIKVNSFNFVGTWRYSCSNTECICKRELYLPTANEIETKNINLDNVVFGECGHGLHRSCLESYLKAYDGMCPFDKLKWSSKNDGNKPKYNVIEK